MAHEAASLAAPPARQQPLAATPAVQAIDAAVLDRIEANLAQLIGPIAKVLVRRMAPAAAGPAELVARLADEIDDVAERKSFVAHCRSAYD